MLNAIKPAVTYRDDCAIVAGLMRKDKEAFHALYFQHSRYLATIVFRLLGNDRDIDDILQETFFAACRSIHKLRSPGQLRIWLIKIAIRYTQKQLHKQRRQQTLHQTLYENRTHPSLADENILALYEALSRLPQKLRVPWILQRVEQMTLEEVSQICGRSLATVKRRIAKAEALLRRRLDVTG